MAIDTGFKPLLDPTVIPKGAEAYGSPTAEGWIDPSTGRASLRGRPPVQPVIEQPDLDVDAYFAANAQPAEPTATPEFDVDAYFAENAQPSEQPDLPSPLVEGAKEAGKQSIAAGGSVLAGIARAGRGVAELAGNVAFKWPEQAADAVRAKFGKPKLEPSLMRKTVEEIGKPTKIEQWSAEQTEKTAQELSKEGIGYETAYRIAQGLGESASSTAIMMGAAGGFGKAGEGATAAKNVWESVKASSPHGAKFAALVYATTPGDQTDRAAAAAHAFAMGTTGAVAGWVPGPILSRAANLAMLGGLNTPAYKEAIERAEQMSEQNGTPLSANLAATLTAPLLMDILFAAVTPNLRPKQEAIRNQIAAEVGNRSKLIDQSKMATPVEGSAQPTEIVPPPIPEQSVKPQVLISEKPTVIKYAKPPVNAPGQPTTQTPVPAPSDALAGRVEAPVGAKTIAEPRPIEKAGSTSSKPPELMTPESFDRDLSPVAQTGRPIRLRLWRASVDATAPQDTGLFAGTRKMVDALRPIVKGDARQIEINSKNPLVIESTARFLNDESSKGDQEATRLLTAKGAKAILGADIEAQRLVAKIARDKGHDAIINKNAMEVQVVSEMALPGYVREGDRYVFKQSAAKPQELMTPEEATKGANVGDIVTWRTATGEDVDVNWRGMLRDDQAVVVSPQGIQITVPAEQLRKRGTPYNGTTVTPQPAPAKAGRTEVQKPSVSLPDSISDDFLFKPKEMRTPAEARKAYWGGTADGRKPTPQEWREVKERHKLDIQKAMGYRDDAPHLTVSAAAVDAYGIKPPPGYVRSGDRYVFKPSAAAAQQESATGTAATPAEGGTQKAVPEPSTVTEPAAQPTGKRYTVKNNPGRVFEIKKTEQLAEWESPEEQAVVLVDTKNGKTLNATMGDLRESVKQTEQSTVKERVSKANRLSAIMAELSPEQQAAVQATPKAQRLEVAEGMMDKKTAKVEAGVHAKKHPNQVTKDGVTVDQLRKQVTGSKLDGELKSLADELRDIEKDTASGAVAYGKTPQKDERGDITGWIKAGKAYPGNMANGDAAVIEKFIKGEPLTPKQADRVSEAVDFLTKRLESAIQKKTMPAASLDTGDTVDINSDTHVVTKNPDGSVTLKDGTTKTLKPGEDVAVDSGSWKPAEQEPSRKKPGDIKVGESPSGQREFVGEGEGFRLTGETQVDQERVKRERDQAVAAKVRQERQQQELPMAGTKGVGAAAAEGKGEFIEGGQVTSLKKKIADIEAAALGRPEEIAAVRRSFPEVAEKVLDKVRKDPNTEQNLIDSLKEKPRALTDSDVATLLLAKVKRLRARNEAASETSAAEQSGDKTRMREAAVAYELADKRLSELLDVASRGEGKSVTETARGLSAMRMVADEDFNIVSMEMAKRAAANNGAPLSPEQKTEVQRVFDLIQKNPTDAKVKKAWRDQLTKDRTDPGKWMEAVDAHLAERKIKFPDGLRSELENEFKQASRIVDESSRNKAVAKVIQKMMDHVPIRKGDWFDAYIYTNMLSGPMSHVRNILGNVTNQTVTRPLSLLFQGKPAQAGKYLANSWGSFFKAWRTAREAFKAGAEGKLMEGISDLKPTATETDKRRAIFEQVKREAGPKNKAARLAWKALNTVGRSMGAMDVFTGEMIKAGEYARLIDAGRPEGIARQSAEKLANDYLYRSKLSDTPDKSLDPITRALGVVASNMDKLRHADNSLARISAKMTVPFLKTPANIAMFNNQMSALGFVGANKNRISKSRYGETFTGLKNKLSDAKKKEIPDTDLIAKLEDQIRDVEDTSAERRGKATLGTLLTVAGSIAAASGNTTWSAPKDEKARKLFYDAGYKPYSFLVGDKWVPMMYLGPGMLAFAAPAAIKAKLMDDPDSIDDSVIERVGKLVAAYPQMMFDQLPIEGVGSLIRLATGDADYTTGRVIGRTAQQLIPFSGALNFIDKIVDPTYRKTVTVGDAVQAGIPGFSDNLEARQTSEGWDAKMSLWDVLTPYKIGKSNPQKEREFKDRMETLRDKAEIRKEKKSD
jgi:hypothetical protein